MSVTTREGTTTTEAPPIAALVVDDEPNIRRTLRVCLEAEGARVVEAATAEAAVAAVTREPFDLALVDLRLGADDGLALTSTLLARQIDLPIVVITAHASYESAVEAIKRGARDYLPKPFTPAQVRHVLRTRATERRTHSRLAELEERLRESLPDADLETRSPVMRKALDLAFRAAESEAAILLRGETGTGKTVLARAVHARSAAGAGALRHRRRHRPVGRAPQQRPVRPRARRVHRGRARSAGKGRCGPRRDAVPRRDRRGGPARPGQAPAPARRARVRAPRRPRAAPGGRAVRHRHQPRPGRPRRAGPLPRGPPVPAQRDRGGRPAVARAPRGLELLAARFLAFFSRRRPRPLELTERARARLRGYAWPGNVRELKNAIERAAILSGGDVIDEAFLPGGSPPEGRPLQLGDLVSLETISDEHIERVVAQVGTLEEAARVLGVDRVTIWRRRRRRVGQGEAP